MDLFWKIIATGFGTGYSPWAPGTAGTLAAAGLLVALSWQWPEAFGAGWASAPWLLGLLVLFTLLGLASVRALQPQWGEDPQRVVVDEMVGLWLAMVGAPVEWPWLLLAVVAFRVFDIWKPLGIRKCERLGGGWGVMADDLLAGLYAWALVQIVIFATT